MTLEVISSLIKGLENQEQWRMQRQYRSVLHHWPQVVGAAVARNTRPVGIQRQILYVATASPTWAQSLTYERLNILQKLNRFQSVPLRNIRFSTAQWHRSVPTKPEKVNTLISDHPSYIGPTSIQPLPAPNPTRSALEAFHQWADAVRSRQSSQPTCPSCHCHCPRGELQRWNLCALCVVKKWR